MSYKQILEDAIKSDQPLIEFREQIIKLRTSGVDKQIILGELETIRGSANNENEEDLILEVMDLLVGYCSSDMRID